MYIYQSTLQSIIIAACLASALVGSLPVALRPSSETSLAAPCLKKAKGVAQPEAVTTRVAHFIYGLIHEPARQVTLALSDAGHNEGDLTAHVDPQQPDGEVSPLNQKAAPKKKKKKKKRSLSEILAYASFALVNGPNIELGVNGIVSETMSNNKTNGFDPP